MPRLKKENAGLREEIARLKGLKGRPKLKPSGMEKAVEAAAAKGSRRKGRRGAKRSKLTLGETSALKPDGCPEAASGWRTSIKARGQLCDHRHGWRRGVS